MQTLTLREEEVMLHLASQKLGTKVGANLLIATRNDYKQFHWTARRRLFVIFVPKTEKYDCEEFKSQADAAFVNLVTMLDLPEDKQPLTMQGWCVVTLPEINREIQKQGPNPETESRELYAAIWADHPQRVKGLLAAGVDVNRVVTKARSKPGPSQDGDTPLQNAIRLARTQIVQLLIDGGANPNTKNTEGETPLETAAVRHQPEILQYLIDHGANVGLKTDFWGSALRAAVLLLQGPGKSKYRAEKEECVFKLWTAGGDLNQEIAAGETIGQHLKKDFPQLYQKLFDEQRRTSFRKIKGAPIRNTEASS
jgi:hypothetical protein